MPKLRRMRLVSVGHDSARFSDLTLDFTDRAGRPTNSVVWLRNGGGKTSLLSLFFAGVRPNKREFLGQRADEKVRSIDDYVGRRDHSLVVCEWELDDENTLFNDDPSRYLSGVFYEWSSSQKESGKSGVDRLFFGAMASPSVDELTLDGLPVFANGERQQQRRTLSGFRRRLKQLDAEHPQQEVFHSDRQNKFEEELASHGIDPEVFYYQIRMNEHEGGVSERFSFSEDGEFVDFLLEMAFSRQRAKEIREQLTTFRQELVERNERLKPELEYCEGLITRLNKLSGIKRDRDILFSDTTLTYQQLGGLKSWVVDTMQSLTAEVKRLKAEISDSQAGADDARRLADKSYRAAAVCYQHAHQLRFDAIDKEYQTAERAHGEATRLKNIWSAARPLARAWEAKRLAKQHREQLARQQKQYAPDLQKLKDTATQLANALDHRATQTRREEDAHSDSAALLTDKAKTAQKDSQAAGELAAKQETEASKFAGQLFSAASELTRLQDTHDLEAGESAARGKERLAAEIALLTTEIGELETTVNQNKVELKSLGEKQKTVQSSMFAEKLEAVTLHDDMKRAEQLRSGLETDAALLRLLQIGEVDVESAAARAVEASTEELRRITESILRIRVESAEDKRALDWLSGDGELLPPSRDVETTLIWLRNNGVTAWSGWEYIEANRRPEVRRATAQRLPFIATGIVVASRDYERVIELAEQESDALSLRATLTIVPAEAISDSHDLIWTVIGPSSDAHFDKEAAAREFNRIEARVKERDEEIDGHTEWQQALTPLRQALRSFQSSYPKGWFARHRQKIDVVEARLLETEKDGERLESQFELIQSAVETANSSVGERRTRINAARHALDRIDSFMRQHGMHVTRWENELDEAKRLAKKHRANQDRLREKAESGFEKAKEHAHNARTEAIAAMQLETELKQLKYVDEMNRESRAGPLESLRADYQSLLNEYESKVNSETLQQLAADKDIEAEKERKEFLRVLSQHSDIDAKDVEDELSGLPDHLSAEMRAEQADRDTHSAWQRRGPLRISWNAKKKELDESKERCDELLKTGELPTLQKLTSEPQYREEADRLDAKSNEQLQLACEFEAEVNELDGKLTKTVHDAETLEKDKQRISSMEANHQEQFDRLLKYRSDADGLVHDVSTRVKDAGDLTRQMGSIESTLQALRVRHRELDERRDAEADGILDWSRQKRFVELPTSVSHRFADKRGEQLESKASFFITQLEDRVLEIERKLEEADKHHDRVVNVVASAVDEGLSLLRRVSRMSRLPESLPQAGKQYLVIETKASDNPLERRAKVSDLIDELLQSGDIGHGLALIQKAVRRVAVHTKVRVLHPDLHRVTRRLRISEMRGKSGGERLTCAILLYCALVRLRQQDRGKKGSSVLILDNPIGTASRVSFLDLQREVAESMNVQLIYATGVRDLNAVGALENIIRLRNSRVDRRTGRRIVELAGDDEWIGQIDAARVVFDSAPGSTVGMGLVPDEAPNEVVDHADDA